MYSNLKAEDQKIIAGDFKVDHVILESWLKALTELRNTCAHHARLWNKVFVNFPKIRKADKGFPVSSGKVNRLGSFIPIFIHFLQVINEKNEWEEALLNILKSCPLIKPFDMGLTGWWK